MAKVLFFCFFIIFNDYKHDDSALMIHTFHYYNYAILIRYNNNKSVCSLRRAMLFLNDMNYIHDFQDIVDKLGP